MTISKVAVLGLGKVGHLAAELLDGAGFAVTAFDNRAGVVAPFAVRPLEVADPAALRAALAGHDAVLSCLPYALNKGVSSVAHGLGLHYFDLTEDVPTTQHIRGLATDSRSLPLAQGVSFDI